MYSDDYINYWAKLISENREFLNESGTPHDLTTLLASFNNDVSDEKFSPTREFAQSAFQIINDRLLDHKLDCGAFHPGGIAFFQVESQPSSSRVGCSKALVDKIRETITPVSITLNGAKTLTLHEWLEVVLHEMIHTYDYVYYPEHYLVHRRSYDCHGPWFMDFGKRFEKDGFHVDKFIDTDIGVNTDDKKVKSILNKRVFILLEGYGRSEGKDPAIMACSSTNVERYVGYFNDKFHRGKLGDTTGISILVSENPEIVRLSKLRMSDSHSNFRFYYYNDKFKENYGPFTVKERYMFPERNPNLTEDKDETEFDDMNHIDDEYARELYDKIDGVESVRKVDDDTYEISVP